MPKRARLLTEVLIEELIWLIGMQVYVQGIDNYQIYNIHIITVGGPIPIKKGPIIVIIPLHLPFYKWLPPIILTAYDDRNPYNLDKILQIMMIYDLNKCPRTCLEYAATIW